MHVTAESSLFVEAPSAELGRRSHGKCVRGTDAPHLRESRGAPLTGPRGYGVGTCTGADELFAWTLHYKQEVNYLSSNSHHTFTSKPHNGFRFLKTLCHRQVAFEV